MSIFIFEDDMSQAYNLKTIVKEICDIHNIYYDFIEVTSRSEQVLKRISETTQTPIYFLDIDIKGEERKGLSVAQQIRDIDEHGIIVFITTHSSFAPISYQYMVSALTFIDKGLHYDARYKMIEQCLHHYKSKNETTVKTDDFILTTEHTTVKVPFNEIEYVMTSAPHRLMLVTEKRVIQFYSSLKEVEKRDNRLIRCHQSYLINKEKIETFDKSNRKVVLQSGHEIPVSRRLIRHVKQYVKGEQ